MRIHTWAFVELCVKKSDEAADVRWLSRTTLRLSMNTAVARNIYPSCHELGSNRLAEQFLVWYVRDGKGCAVEYCYYYSFLAVYYTRSPLR